MKLEFKNNCLIYAISDNSAFKKTWEITNEGIIEIKE